MIKKVILVIDINGNAIYDFSSLENGNYTYRIKHFDDTYYDEIWTEGEFNLTNSNLNQSKVRININDGKEFEWGKCNISFEVTKRITVDVLITNEDESFYFEVQGTDLNYVILDLLQAIRNTISVYIIMEMKLSKVVQIIKHSKSLKSTQQLLLILFQMLIMAKTFQSHLQVIMTALHTM